MAFVHPYFLFGLLAVSIPVIIHLFNFRRYRKVYFTNVRFIRELKQETRKRSQLKHLIILLLRILTIIALVFVFAQPYIPVNENIIDQNKPNAVSIFIDNSFSMEATAGGVTLFDIARERAAEIAGIYKTTDRFSLVTNDLEQKHRRMVPREEFMEFLDELEISPVTRNVSEIYRRMSDQFTEIRNANKTAYMLSDFQKITADIDNIQGDTTFRTLLAPVQTSNPANLYIDSCWFESPSQLVGQQAILNVRIRNSGDQSFERIPLKLISDNTQKALAGFSVEANNYAIVQLPFTNYSDGIQSDLLRITDYPITYDDEFFLSYAINESIPVMCIGEEDGCKYIRAVCGNDSLFAFTEVNVNRIDYSSFSNYYLIILQGLNAVSSGLGQELKKFVDNGGSIAIFPSAKMNIAVYNDFLASFNYGEFSALDTTSLRTSDLNTEHPLFEDVFESIPRNMDLPQVHAHFPFHAAPRSSSEVLMSLQNGDMFMSSLQSGTGTLYLFSVELSSAFSNFQKHAIFVPVLYKMALRSQPYTRLYYTLGVEENIEIARYPLAGDQVFHLKAIDGDMDVIPGYKNSDSRTTISLYGQVREAGNYLLTAGDRSLAGISFNYDRRESDLSVLEPDTLKQIIRQNGLPGMQVLDDAGRSFIQTLEEINRGIRIWKWFVIAALIFIAGEVIVIRYL